MTQKNRINEAITAREVRLIDDEGKQVGIVSVDKALALAQEKGLDLVEIAPNANPPVCKILDYGKYVYEQSKKEKLSKKKQHTVVVKEIRMRPKTEDHDLKYKLKHAREFLMNKNKVKFTVHFRGRELAHKEFGERLLEKIENELSDIAKVEGKKQFEGRNMTMVMTLK
ncbi:translation initiation factor IF-3 [Calditrichota bacterium GD2]